MENKNVFEMEYKCANCGNIYTVELRKGTAAKGAGGNCPNYGVASGKAGIGEHEMTWPSRPLAVGNQEILHG